MKLAVLVTDYIAFKRTLGLRYRTDAHVLKAFCRALGDIDLGAVTLAGVEAFLAGHGPVTSAWHKKFEILNRFYRFAQGREWVNTVPLQYSRRNPYRALMNVNYFSRLVLPHGKILLLVIDSPEIIG